MGPPRVALPGGCASQAQVSQGEEGVPGVFAVGGVVGPVSVEGSAAGPEGVQEIQGGLLEVLEGDLCPGQGVQGGGGRQQVGDRGALARTKAALRAGLSQKPVGASGQGRGSKLSEKGQGGGGIGSRGSRQARAAGKAPAVQLK